MTFARGLIKNVLLIHHFGAANNLLKAKLSEWSKKP